MTRFMEWLCTTVGGALLVMAMVVYLNGDTLNACVALAGFVVSAYLWYVQPSNVEGGLIVQVPTPKVTAFVNGRTVQWCGNSYLHDLHVWSPAPLGAPAQGDTVPSAWITTLRPEVACLGHKCRTPESHMDMEHV